MQQSCLILLAIGFATGCPALAEDKSATVAPVQTIPLEGVEGRIDHFGFDSKGQRLFVAALGNDTVEVIDLKTATVTQRLKSLRAPQGIAFAPDVDRLAVANDKDGSCRLYDGTLKPVTTVDLKDDADNVRYDPESHRFWVGYADGGLAAIDAVTGKQVADVKLDAHPESFQLETKGKRIFVNVTSAGHIAVLDREKAAVTAKWPLHEARGNFPMALDEADHRLFLGCRNPAKLLVLDTESGKTVAALDCVADTDDVFYDADAKQIYVSGGAGSISVITQTNPDQYRLKATIPTAPGARTSFFVPETHLLYLAVPHRGIQRAEIRVYKMNGSDAR
jgi:YVTN family beta-propeller protein